MQRSLTQYNKMDPILIADTASQEHIKGLLIDMKKDINELALDLHEKRMALDKAENTIKNSTQIEHLKMNTQQIAKQILELDPIILDTETTGLDDNDQIIEIAAITVSGQPLLNTLVKANKDSHPMALQTHGISREITDLKGREWSDVLADLNAIFECHPMCAYNEVFDTRMITQTCKAHKTEQPLHTTQFDIMELANRHFIEHTIWCNERSQFKRLSLAKCCEIAGIEFQGNAHRAIVDCHATLDLLKFMAEEKPDVASNDDEHTLVIEA